MKCMKKRPPFYTPNWNARFGQITVSLEGLGISLIWWTRTRRRHHALCYTVLEQVVEKKRGETF